METNQESRRPRVLVADPIAREGIDLLATAAEVVVQTGMSPAQLLETIPTFDALVVRSESKVTADVIAAGKQLQVIARAGVGVDNIDVQAATAQGLIVVYAPTGNTVAATEHTLAMLLALARHIPQANAALRNGKWERARFTGTELRGKTLGLIGLGRVGGEVVRRARAFELKAIAYDPFLPPEAAERMGAHLVSLEEVLQQADFLSIHAVLTEQNRGMIGAAQLAMMKPTARIINCARGGILNEDALLEAIRAGRIAGAALDVFAREPATDSPLIQEEHVITTPHLGASTTEAQVNVAIDVAEQILAVFRGEAPRYAVNVPISAAAAATVRPYLPVADVLGRLATLLSDGQLRSLEITYAGNLASQETDALRLAVLAGLLGPISATRVSLVNAGEIARQRGLRVAENREPEAPGSYVGLLTVKVVTDGDGVEVSGTIVNDEPRIVRIDGYWVDVRPNGGYWIFGRHSDRPGIIGRIGTLLGEADINISFMQVGRREARGEALLVLGVDEPVSDEVRQKLLALPHIQRAKVVRL